MSPCTLTSQLQLIRADIRAYRALRRYHYCDGAGGPYCAIYALVKEGVTALPGTVNSDHSWVAALPGGAGNDGELTETVAGVIVYAPSPLNNAARDRATGGIFAMRPKAEKLALLNAHVRRISRRRTMPPGVERTAFVLNRLGVWPVYYTWRNPEQTVEGLDLAGE